MKYECSKVLFRFQEPQEKTFAQINPAGITAAISAT